MIKNMNTTLLQPNENGIYEIEHLGKVLKTTKYDTNVSIDVINEARQHFYPQPSLSEVKKNLKNLYNGKISDTEIYYYFFFKLVCDCRVFGTKWSIEEFLESDDLMRHAFWYMNSNEKVFPTKTISYSALLRTKFFSVCGNGLAVKPSNFPFVVIKELLQTYKEKILYYRSQNYQEMKEKHPSYFQGGFNYLDSSSGWGARLSGAMSSNINYFGTDPNTKLMEKLHELKDLFYSTVDDIVSTVDLRNHGSEVFIPEWEDKADFIMTSPPYFGKELYIHGKNQSTDVFPTYNEWLNGYWRGTAKNLKKYLRMDGYCIINIKGYSKYDLIEDTKKIAIEEGLQYIGEHELSLKNRKSLHEDEGIMTFVHKEFADKIGIKY